MWIGSIKWNFIVAAIVGGFAFIFSFMNNLLLESLLRSLLAFFLFFVLMFIFRFLASKTIGKDKHMLASEEKKGQHIDLVTPEKSTQQDEERIERQAAQPGFSGFTPADFPHISRNGKDNIAPEEVARALRVFSNED
jgi:hypothetical protein